MYTQSIVLVVYNIKPTLVIILSFCAAKPHPVNTETAKIWTLSADDVLDNDLVSINYPTNLHILVDMSCDY